MRRRQPSGIARIALVLLRSLLVGAVSGVIGGALIFFFFGFIGLAGAPFGSKLANGWQALVDPGLGKGLVVGAGIAVGLIAAIEIWTLWARRFDPTSARPPLAALAGAIVVLFNLESIRSSAGWDWAGIATVGGIALLVGAVVWLVTPWVFRDWQESLRRLGGDSETRGFAVREDG